MKDPADQRGVHPASFGHSLEQASVPVEKY